MKKLFASAAILFAGAAVSVNAQTARPVENVISLGVGVSVTDNYNYRMGSTFSASYGLDIRLAPCFSIMPSIGAREVSESRVRPTHEQVNLNDFFFLQGDISGKFHFGNLALGLGPYVAYAVEAGEYETLWETESGFEVITGRPKIKKYDYGVVPSATFLVNNRINIGVKANIGLRDVNIQYPECILLGSRYIESMEVTLGLKF